MNLHFRIRGAFTIQRHTIKHNYVGRLTETVGYLKSIKSK
jgi:hypothetical protein